MNRKWPARGAINHGYLIKLSPGPSGRISQLLHFLSPHYITNCITTPATMALSLQSTYKLVSGYEIPVVGFGVCLPIDMEVSELF